MDIRTFQHGDFEEVVALWERCDLVTPPDDPETVIERKIAHDPALFLVAEVNGEVVGTLLGGYDGYRGYAYYLAVHPEFQGRGIANAMVARLEKKLLARGCPQLLLAIPDDNTATLSMFDKLAYDECQQDSLTYSKRLITDPEY